MCLCERESYIFYVYICIYIDTDIERDTQRERERGGGGRIGKRINRSTDFCISSKFEFICHSSSYILDFPVNCCFIQCSFNLLSSPLLFLPSNAQEIFLTRIRCKIKLLTRAIALKFKFVEIGRASCRERVFRRV